MIDQIIKNPELEAYAVNVRAGQTIFLEGDDSQDLYILVSGKVDIIKGNTKIAETSEPGSIIGEMSFLLGESRTATVKAKEDIKVLRIPKEEAGVFLERFPYVTAEISRVLARRLEETSTIMFGLREFTDQLPDAVIHTDKDGEILTWNRAAEIVYGRELAQVQTKGIGEIFEDQEEYRAFFDQSKAGVPIKEKVIKTRHPDKGIRFISTSTTILYDGHHNFQGVLSTGRDVTEIKKLEKRYRWTKRWLVPVLCSLLILIAAVFYGFPYFSKGYETVDVTKRDLRDLLAKDYLLLHSLIVEPFALRDRQKTNEIMKEFFDIQESKKKPVTGLVLLDNDKRVFNSYSISEDIDSHEFVGHSYTGIPFRGEENSPHKVIILYRSNKGNPMGRRGIEIAFELLKDRKRIGWLILQMDVGLLRSEYGINARTLQMFEFKRP
ncbi:cyclic nucleotide-binding domain-containing protein [Thermodesulfobacteriota bacterium]